MRGHVIKKELSDSSRGIHGVPDMHAEKTEKQIVMIEER